ncbi:hypothetical protein M8C21_020351, partial [Ambrosia artemisiifolia]
TLNHTIKPPSHSLTGQRSFTFSLLLARRERDREIDRERRIQIGSLERGNIGRQLEGHNQGEGHGVPFPLIIHQMISIAANDVAFSSHGVLLTAFTLFQIAIYDAIMNFKRKSIIGFSIGNILLDLLGGLTNYGQMVVQSIDQ